MAKFESEESAFNFAIDYLKGISESLKMCKVYSSLKDIDNWYSWLRNAYKELSVKTNNKEDKEFEDKFKEINKLMNNPDSRHKQGNEILFKLDQLEIKIRKKLQERGMLLPSKSDPRFAVLER